MSAGFASLLGNDKYNNSMVGWGGHTEEGKSRYQDAAVLFKKIMVYHDLSDFATQILFYQKDEWENVGTKKDIDAIVKTKKLFGEMYCFTLSNKFTNNINSIIFNFVDNLDVTIRLLDSNLMSERYILEHSVNYISGEKVTFENRNKTTEAQFIIKLEQDVFVEEDVTKHCSVYPTSQYSSYSECDRQSGLAELAKGSGPGFMPLWAAKNISQATVQPKFYVPRVTESEKCISNK